MMRLLLYNMSNSLWNSLPLQVKSLATMAMLDQRRFNRAYLQDRMESIVVGLTPGVDNEFELICTALGLALLESTIPSN